MSNVRMSAVPAGFGLQEVRHRMRIRVVRCFMGQDAGCWLLVAGWAGSKAGPSGVYVRSFISCPGIYAGGLVAHKSLCERPLKAGQLIGH